MADESPWEAIPNLLAGTVGSISLMATKVTAASEPRWVGRNGPGEMNYVRTVKLSQRMYAVDRKQKTFLFIFYSDPTRQVLMDAGIDLYVAPVSEPPPLPVADDADSWEVQYPAFLVRNLSDADVSRFGPENATRANTLFLGLGKNGADLLAVRLDIKPPRWRYSPGSAPGNVEPQNGNYSLAPIMELIRTLVENASQPSLPGQPITVRRSTSTAVQNSLDVVLRAHSAAVESLIPSATTMGLPDWFQKYFTVLNYRASLNFHLNAKGQPAADARDEQYQVTASLSVDTPEQTLARISVETPDWIVPSDQQGPFFDALLSPDALDFLSTAIATVLQVQTSFVRTFIDSARDGSSMLRCARDGDDTMYLIVLNGMVDKTPAGILLSLSFISGPEVDTDADAAVTPLSDLSGSVIPADSTPAANLFQMLNSLRSWSGFLA